MKTKFSIPEKWLYYAIFFFGSLFNFFTSMSKVLVPGTVFDELQSDLKISGATLSLMGSVYMYCYAASQLLVGVLTTRFGGVRILLWGGSIFVFGSMIFPLLSNPYLMILARAITGLGAGSCFVGLARIISDMFPVKFTFMLGLALFINYLGPVTGGLPMTWLSNYTGWRTTLLIPATLSAINIIICFVLLRKKAGPISKEGTFKPLFIILSKVDNWKLYITSSVVFGAFYTILTIMGKKALIDFCKLSPAVAATWITIPAILIAFCNLATGKVISLLGNKHKKLVLFASIFSFLGIALACVSFTCKLGATFVISSYLIMAIPAGFFALYCTISKELNPPEYIGLALAILNFFAFAIIALDGNIAGFILKLFETSENLSPEGIYNYPPSAYAIIFGVLSLLAIIGLIAALFLPETGTKSQNLTADKK